MRPLVSAILTTYGRTELLHEALDSVYAQEGQGDIFDLEAVVVDDASPNDARAVVARYPAKFIRHPVNRGVAAALNTGIAATGGAYVAFLDEDDLWLPGRIFEELLIWNFVGYFTVLMRRTALASVGYLDETLRSNEDYDLWLRLAYHFPFKFVPGQSGVYRPSPQGLFVTKIATGASRQLLRRVIDKALAMAPELCGETAQAIRLRVELRNFANLTLLPAQLALPQMLAYLQECPAIAQDSFVCNRLAHVMRLEAIASSSPWERASSICAALKENVGEARARRLVATIWAGMAFGLLSAGRGGDAILAARRAFPSRPCGRPPRRSRLGPPGGAGSGRTGFRVPQTSGVTDFT